ncbi:MAG: DMT family transporter [Bacteroidetes bacterium]|nr:DMT family transporter [Bacteroidota bacterium]
MPKLYRAHSREKWGHLALVLQTLIMGPGYTFGKYAAMGMPAEVLTWLRMVVITAALGLFFLATGGHRKIPRTRRFFLSVLGLCLVGSIGNMYFFILGVRYTTPAQSSILYALTPLCVLMLSAWVLRAERFTGRKLLAALVALLGVLIVMYPGMMQAGRGSDELKGNLLNLLSVACWSVFIVLSGRVFRAIHPLHSSALLWAAGLLCFSPIGLPALAHFDLATVPRTAWYGFAYITLGNAGLSYLLIVYGMQLLRPSQVAVYLNVQPIAAALYSILLGVEVVTTYLVVGGLLTIAGVYGLNRVSAHERRVHAPPAVPLEG